MAKLTRIVCPANRSGVPLRIDLEKNTIWASQKEIAQLFGIRVPAVAKLINNIFLTDELDRSVVSKMETSATVGKHYQVDHYSLDMIMTIGRRTNSQKAAWFRQWATKTLSEYVPKAF